MKPGFGRWSLMLCRRAIEMGSSLRFCAVRPSNRPCDGRRPVGDAGIAAGGLPVLEAVESARSVRNLVVSAMVEMWFLFRRRLCCGVGDDVGWSSEVGSSNTTSKGGAQCSLLSKPVFGKRGIGRLDRLSSRSFDLHTLDRTMRARERGGGRSSHNLRSLLSPHHIHPITSRSIHTNTMAPVSSKQRARASLDRCWVWIDHGDFRGRTKRRWGAC